VPSGSVPCSRRAAAGQRERGGERLRVGTPARIAGKPGISTRTSQPCARSAAAARADVGEAAAS
jgi:hypothetical protein